MGRIKGKDSIKQYIKKYSGGGVDFFSLKDDGDTATVRLLHGLDDDLEIALVHEVEIAGKKKYVECLEDDCPLCQQGKPALKLYIFVYDYEDEKIKVWERGISIVDHLLGFIERYGRLDNRDYEIQRHGKKGSTKTSYQFFPGDKEELAAKFGEEDLPKRPDLYGRFVLQYSKEEMVSLIAGDPVKERPVGTGTF